MKTIYAIPGEPISLGREGENNARQILFDLRPWNDLYGPGVAQLVAQRSGETTPYPVAITTDGNDAIWTVTDADTAIPGTNGKAELRYYVGETLAKSATWMTIVMDALGDPSEEPPEPYQGWLDQILAAGSDAEAERIKAEAAADRADAALPRAPRIWNGNWQVWDAEEEKYVNTGVSAKGNTGDPGFSIHAITVAVDRPIGSSAQVAIGGFTGRTPVAGDLAITENGLLWEITSAYLYLTTLNLTIKCVADLNGDKGDTGNGIKSIARTAGTGAAGTTDTYTITYTDGSTSTYTVYNGKDGTDGYTPRKGVDYFDGTSVTVQSVSESTADGGTNVVTFSDGQKLNVKNGSGGKTPVKGTDYWTDADKQEMVNDVLAALPVYNGEVENV